VHTARLDDKLDLDPERIVFIDETGASTKMARTHGREPVPRGHRKTITFVGALRRGGMTAPIVLERPVNAKALFAYVGPVLAPTLSPGDIVMMDNRMAHKPAAIADGITPIEPAECPNFFNAFGYDCV
jgi:hypothetical protein